VPVGFFFWNGHAGCVSRSAGCIGRSTASSRRRVRHLSRIFARGERSFTTCL
jgi:hypothetical protein